MNERLEDLMYRAGLTAQGCWDNMDQYDREAIERFANLIVSESINVVNNDTWAITIVRTLKSVVVWKI